MFELKVKVNEARSGHWRVMMFSISDVTAVSWRETSKKVPHARLRHKSTSSTVRLLST